MEHVAPVTRADHQRYGRKAQSLPPPLTRAQQAALTAALDADKPPRGLYFHARRHARTGPAHLSSDRVRAQPLPMPPD